MNQTLVNIFQFFLDDFTLASAGQAVPNQGKNLKKCYLYLYSELAWHAEI